MNGNILVVGGYGGVGRFISTALGERFPGQVVVAGRSSQKARDFASDEKKLGVLSLLRFAAVRNMYLKMLGSIHMGSDMFIAQVVAEGTANGEPTSYACSVSGHGEGRITGLMAAEVAEHLYTSTTPPGVFHIEQLFDRPREFIEGFAERVTDLEHRFRTPGRALHLTAIPLALHSGGRAR